MLPCNTTPACNIFPVPSPTEEKQRQAKLGNANDDLTMICNKSSALGAVFLLWHITNAAAVTSVGREHQSSRTTTWQDSKTVKFSKSQLVVHMTVSEVPDKYRLRMPVLDKSLLQVKKKKKKIHRYPSATTLSSNSVLIWETNASPNINSLGWVIKRPGGWRQHTQASRSEQ